MNPCYEDGKCHFKGDCEHKYESNADLIRQMTDEALADFIVDVSKCCAYVYGGKCMGCNEPWCEFYLTLDWLKKPVNYGEAAPVK